MAPSVTQTCVSRQKKQPINSHPGFSFAPFFLQGKPNWAANRNRPPASFP